MILGLLFQKLLTTIKNKVLKNSKNLNFTTSNSKLFSTPEVKLKRQIILDTFQISTMHQKDQMHTITLFGKRNKNGYHFEMQGTPGFGQDFVDTPGVREAYMRVFEDAFEKGMKYLQLFIRELKDCYIFHSSLVLSALSIHIFVASF